MLGKREKKYVSVKFGTEKLKIHLKIHTMSKREISAILKIFQIKFGKLLRKKHKGAGELLVLLSIGLMQGWTSVNALSTHLGIPKDKCYNHLKSLPLRKWRELFKSCFLGEAIDLLSDLAEKSASTISKAGASLQIDDSVLRKWMGHHYFYSWYSGQYKKVVKGYDVVVVTLVIKGQVLPLAFWIMSKKGSYTNRPNRAADLVSELKQEFKSQGVSLEKIPVSADAAFLTSDLVDTLKEQGFRLVLGTKGQYRVHLHKYKQVYQEKSVSIREVFKQKDYETLPEKSWGIQGKVLAQKIKSAKWGKALLLEKIQLGKPKRVLAFGFHRVAQADRVWKNHHKVEWVFRALKHLLGWGKYALQGNKGVYATVVIPFLAFAILSHIRKECGCTFEKIILAFKIWNSENRQELFQMLNLEYFQLHLPTFDSIMGNSS